MSDDPLEALSKYSVSKLKAAGISDIEVLSKMGIKDICDLTGVSKEKAEEIWMKTVKPKIERASDILERRKNIFRITTGSKSFDGILGGGIESQALTELVGEFGTGKSQLCHTLAVTVQLPRDQGGAEGSAIYLDTEHTFRPERICQIAEGRGLDPKKILQNIYVAEALSSDHLALLVDECFRLAPKHNVRLIVVDSIIGRFRPEYVGRENLAERQQKLNLILHRLLKLSEAYNLAVVATNQVVATVNQQYVGLQEKPAGGNITGHNFTYRIWLRRGKGRNRIVKIFDSPCHPEAEAHFQITEKGIEDLPHEEDETEQ